MCIQISNGVEKSLERKTENLEASCSVVEHHTQHSSLTKLAIHDEQAEGKNVMKAVQPVLGTECEPMKCAALTNALIVSN